MNISPLPFFCKAPVFGLVLMVALSSVFTGIAWAHPLLERKPGNSMKGPQMLAGPRLPLGTAPPRNYLPPKAAKGNMATPLFQSLLSFYRKVISPLDGDRCQMAPTCSLYAAQAFNEYGVMMGFLLTADRLLHEGDEVARAPVIKEKGEKFYVDPLWNNTYWLPSWLRR